MGTGTAVQVAGLAVGVTSVVTTILLARRSARATERREATPQDVPVDPHAALLFRCYAESLLQAKVAFRVSLMFVFLGSCVLLVASAFAVARGGAGVGASGAVVPVTGGAVVSLLGVGLITYSGRTMQHFENQIGRLQEDQNGEREYRRRIDLISRIDDSVTRDRTFAAIAALPVSGQASAGPQDTPDDSSTATGPQGG